MYTWYGTFSLLDEPLSDHKGETPERLPPPDWWEIKPIVEPPARGAAQLPSTCSIYEVRWRVTARL